MPNQKLIEFMLENMTLADIIHIAQAGHEIHRAKCKVYNLTYKSGTTAEGGQPAWNVTIQEVWEAAVQIDEDWLADAERREAEEAAYRKSLEDETMKEVHERGQ